MPREKLKPLDYDTYLSERKELYKYQQAAYDVYEKTLTVLVGSTLALSVAFLGFLQSSRAKGVALLALDTECWLYLSWGSLAAALVALLLCFFVNARAFTVEMKVLDEALTDGSALERTNAWRNVSLFLYTASSILFIVGLLSLLYFCKMNSLHISV